MDRSKLLKMLALLGAIILFVASLSKFVMGDSMTLTDYAEQNSILKSPSPSPAGAGTDGSPEPSSSPDSVTDDPDASGSPSPEDTPAPDAPVSQLIGATLNGSSQQEERWTLEEAFYCEPLSDHLRRYITGVSYPALTEDDREPEITLDELRYVHILHYDFDGNPAEGELICNEAIARDLVEIFYELYRSEYRLEHVLLIDEYDGDETASAEDNNTSCFNYRTAEDESSLSKHALGLAVDVNPFYNPYITYNGDGSENVFPTAAIRYADRSASFPYKIDENDLCYKLFIQHGFIWGGNWNDSKDYRHFQKAVE